MPSLRDYRDRIASVKSTRKITSAMKMVAASKLKRAQTAAEASRAYAESMSNIILKLASEVVVDEESPKLLVGTGKSDVHLLVIVSADRGLCGGFNANIIRQARQKIIELEDAGKIVKLICVGRKSHDAFKRQYADKILKHFINLGGKKVVGFSVAEEIIEFILAKFDDGEFDVCTLVYNEFKSVLTQKPVAQQLVPFSIPEIGKAVQDNVDNARDVVATSGAPYLFEPDQATIFNELMPKNLGVQMYRALLDSAAGEQAARMTAMDNATRNAGDMINDLTLQYNRARQAYITSELIEIISGAEALN